MDVRTLHHDSVLIVQLCGKLELGHLYQIIRLAEQEEFHRYGGGRIYDIRHLDDHVGSISEQVRAVEDWLRKAPKPDQPVVFVSRRGWAMAANRVIRQLLNLDNWHLTDDFSSAFDILGVQGDPGDVLQRLESQTAFQLHPDAGLSAG